MYTYYSGSVYFDSDSIENAPLQFDSIEIVAIKSGYYFKRELSEISNPESDFNEIHWIYISPDDKVKYFTTANYEYCMSKILWHQTPKKIYKQIKRNTTTFDSLYLACNQQEFVQSNLKKDNKEIIVINHTDGDIIHREEIIFIKGALLLKIRDYERILSMESYKFIGK
jgi:hypothetical protein